MVARNIFVYLFSAVQYTIYLKTLLKQALYDCSLVRNALTFAVFCLFVTQLHFRTSGQSTKSLEKVISLSVANQIGGAIQRQFADALKVHVQQPANDGWKRKQLDVWSTSKAAGDDKGYSLLVGLFPIVMLIGFISLQLRVAPGNLIRTFHATAIYQWNFKIYMSLRNIRYLLESSKVLNSSYKNRNNVNYLTKMGIAIEFWSMEPS
ncbi:uncharacterized protein LOC114542446 [Dendronephthya gigantea]|uniref:uncharacterized protein LOC114542446 n=1 Tax=Dendronephthya gigantea TaxID=151771 RepID=UPI00106972D7|nr:uncharacterized protein LOC114542446 [Dendronephthya gigantea]